MAGGFQAVEPFDPARIEHDGADRIGFAGVFRAILAPLPRRADAADEIERGVEARRQFGGDFALAQAAYASSLSAWLCRFVMGGRWHAASGMPPVHAGGMAPPSGRSDGIFPIANLLHQLNRIKISLYPILARNAPRHGMPMDQPNCLCRRSPRRSRPPAKPRGCASWRCWPRPN